MPDKTHCRRELRQALRDLLKFYDEKEVTSAWSPADTNRIKEIRHMAEEPVAVEIPAVP